MIYLLYMKSIIKFLVVGSAGFALAALLFSSPAAIGDETMVLKYPVDATTQATIEKAVDVFLKDKVFDIAWKKMFHWMTMFESLDGFDQVASSDASIRIDGSGVILATGPNGGSYAEVAKQPLWQGLATFGQRSNFRSAFVLNAADLQTAYIRTGIAGGQGYGFKVVENTLYGFSTDGVTEETVAVGNIVTGRRYNIEARYTPNDKVVFFTDTTERGSVYKHLPSALQQSNGQLMSMRIIARGGQQRSMQVSFFEYLQSRNALQ
jgi:hypothetical protein